MPDLNWGLGRVTQGPSTQDTKRTIEASLWDYEDGFDPPRTVVDQRPDRLLWRTPSSSIYANKVVRTSFTEAGVEGAVTEVMDFFAAAAKSFSWWIGPSSDPPSLEQRLLARGLVREDTYEGVALVLPGGRTAAPARPALRQNPNVVVEVVRSEATVRELVAVNAAVWGYSAADQERMVHDRLEYLRFPGCRSGYLLGRIDGMAVGTASYRYSGSGEALYLTGASTLLEFRGRGVFTELVRWRVADAAARGCRLVTCLARVGTSAPILMKLGFQQYLTLPVLAWDTGAAGHS
ncbi:MAG: GNAT family N-acetyltransferase [Symbiobacteriia bacterium]